MIAPRKNILGKGEVESSNLSGSTSFFNEISPLYSRLCLAQAGRVEVRHTQV